MKASTKKHSDGLEWLREARRDLMREIGATPQERGAYYREMEKELGGRMFRGRFAELHTERAPAPAELEGAIEAHHHGVA
jgi:hypothetical protein